MVVINTISLSYNIILMYFCNALFNLVMTKTFSIKSSRVCLFALLLAVFSCTAINKSLQPVHENVSIVFEPDGQYTSMRIPALVATGKGSLLAFCEGRLGTSSDWADINLIMRRSTDEGRTWSQVYILDSMKGAPVGNPTPIVDDRGRIHLLYQKDYARAYYTYSDDDGISWSKPADITETFNRFRPEYNWNVLAPGPGHSIQLKNGRLLAPVWLANSPVTSPRRKHAPSCVATIYSDDYGKTWQRGAIVADNTPHISNPNESMAVQLQDGTVLLSIRNPSAVLRRAFSTSPAGIDNWSSVRFEEELFDPTCMAGIITLPLEKGKDALLFVNPDSRDIEKHPRANLSAKVSFDNGHTWPVNKVLDAGPAGYSDLALGKNGMIYVLYETNTVGTGFDYTLVLKKFNTKWLLGAN